MHSKFDLTRVQLGSECLVQVQLRSPIYSKFDLTRVRIYDLQIMDSTFHVPEMLALTTETSLTSLKEMYHHKTGLRWTCTGSQIDWCVGNWTKKCYAPQVWPNWGLNPLNSCLHGPIFHVPETLALTTEPSGTLSSALLLCDWLHIIIITVTYISNIYYLNQEQ